MIAQFLQPLLSSLTSGYTTTYGQLLPVSGFRSMISRVEPKVGELKE